jgi:hypothetical protein
MSEKTQLEFSVELINDTRAGQKRIKLRKYMEASFVPQHGMEILDSGIVFRVKTIPLAGLSGLMHVAHPLPQENKRLFLRSEQPNEKWLNECVNTLKNQGWSVVK